MKGIKYIGFLTIFIIGFLVICPESGWCDLFKHSFTGSITDISYTGALNNKDLQFTIGGSVIGSFDYQDTKITEGTTDNDMVSGAFDMGGVSWRFMTARGSYDSVITGDYPDFNFVETEYSYFHSNTRLPLSNGISEFYNSVYPTNSKLLFSFTKNGDQEDLLGNLTLGGYVIPKGVTDFLQYPFSTINIKFAATSVTRYHAPEPGSVILFSLGIMGIARSRGRKVKHAI